MTDDESRAVFYATLAAIPPGRYCSYGDLARLSGVHVRQVLAWLRRLPADTELPWHRLVTAQCKVADYPGNTRQFRRLAAEGVVPGRGGRLPRELRWPDA